MNPIINPKILGRTITWDDEDEDENVVQHTGTIVAVSTDSEGNIWFLAECDKELHSVIATEATFTETYR